MAMLGPRHSQDALDMVEVDLAEVALGELNGSADDAPGEGSWQGGQFGYR
jgi:hypothetical protein